MEGKLCARSLYTLEQERGRGGNAPSMRKVFRGRRCTIYIACSSREQAARNFFAKGHVSGSLLLCRGAHGGEGKRLLFVA